MDIIFRSNSNEFFIIGGTRPSEKQQVYDEILRKERRLGALLGHVRDAEGKVKYITLRKKKKPLTTHQVIELHHRLITWHYKENKEL